MRLSRCIACFVNPQLAWRRLHGLQANGALSSIGQGLDVIRLPFWSVRRTDPVLAERCLLTSLDTVVWSLPILEAMDLNVMPRLSQS